MQHAIPTSGGNSIEITTNSSDADIVEAITSLADEVATLKSENEQLRSDLEETQDELKRTHEELAATRQRLETVETELEDVDEHRGGLAHDIAKTNQRVTTLEAALEDGTTAEDEPDSPSLQDTIETPLEQIAALPEDVAEAELTANQDRARFVARGVRDYTSKAPCGRVMTSSDLRQVLSAAGDSRIHPQTVTRVIEFLDRFGEDDVEVVTRRNQRRIVFSEALADRLVELETAQITPCVIGQTVEA